MAVDDPGPGPAAARRGPAGIDAAAQVFVDDLDVLAVDEGGAHHLLRALRLRPGEVVVAADGRGRWRPCRIAASARRAGSSSVAEAIGSGLLEADGPVRDDGEPPAPVTVAFAPVKGERPEWVVQKLTELGVDRIVVLRAARSVVRWEAGRAERALERLGRVAREAAAQSRRSRLPLVQGVWSLAELTGALAPEPVALADPGGTGLPGTLRALAVGPEGGWDEAERSGAGLARVDLGPTVLRAETAALAAGTLLCALRDGRLRAV